VVVVVVVVVGESVCDFAKKQRRSTGSPTPIVFYVTSTTNSEIFEALPNNPIFNVRGRVDSQVTKQNTTISRNTADKHTKSNQIIRQDG
jgi:hypothetical protein